MEYVTYKFENTVEGLAQKNAYTKEVAAQGYRIVSEQVENGHIKGDEQCCGALICLPLIFLAGRTPGAILVTYGRETLYCTSCGAAVAAEHGFCSTCRADLSKETVADLDSARLIAEGKREAARRTAEINDKVGKFERVLTDSLALDHQFDWNSLRTGFSVPQPEVATLYDEPQKPTGLRLSSKIPIIEKLIPAVREKRVRWEKASEQRQQYNQLASAQHDRDLNDWRSRCESIEQEQTTQIEAKKRLYLAKDTTILLQYWAKVLERSQHLNSFPCSHVFDYTPGEQRLIIEVTLPAIASLPQVGEVKYNRSRNTLEEIPVSELWLNEIYGDLVIKIALRTIHELFQSDVAEALTSITFNGSIRLIDRSNGQGSKVILVSIEASKAEFIAINLAQVDPKACFTRLSGVLSENLAKSTPIAPVRYRA